MNQGKDRLFVEIDESPKANNNYSPLLKFITDLILGQHDEEFKRKTYAEH